MTALELACYFQNRCCELEEIIDMFCLDAEAALQSAQPVAQPERVYLVATGEVYEGQETYTRHDAPVPLADYETLYTTAQPVAQPTIKQSLTVAGRNRDAFKAYLSDCERCCISPYVAGAFNAGWSAQPVAQPLSDDPLQGAVDWILQADGEFFCVATVQRTLRIDYNRAKSLCDMAKERAHGIGAKE